MRSFLRLLLVTPVLFILVTFGVFLLIDLAPGDAAVAIAGADATAEDIERIREQLGLNDPLLVRYGSWVLGVLAGDFGYSYNRLQPVGDLILSRAEPTIALAAVSTLLAIIVGVFLGAVATIKPNGVVDRAASVFASAGIALPQFWVGLMLVVTFSLQLGWFPAVNYIPLASGFAPWLHHLVLPAVALAWLPASEIARHVRSSTMEVLEKPYILTAQTKGILRQQIYLRHVSRNAAIPVVTVLGSRVAQLLGGTVVIETVFGIKGLGTLTVDSVLARDMPVVLGLVALATAVVLVVNFLVDLSYGFIDPRVNKA